MNELELLITLWPSEDFFKGFAFDKRISAIRLNSAKIDLNKLSKELEIIESLDGHIPLYFDIKGRQLRIKEVIPNSENLEIILNHPIEVKTPTPVIFKAGADSALLREVKDGNHLIFYGGPRFIVEEGDSLHIRDGTLKVKGPTFLPYEIEKIEMTRKFGFQRYFLSYVENQRDIDEFKEYVGDSHVIAKIENRKGLEFIAKEFKPQKMVNLMAARGDLYVEVTRPHQIMDAVKSIINKDKNAYLGSRILLSLVNESVPSVADFSDLAWHYDLGYKRFMLCDELCLKEDLVSTAINVFESFKRSYKSNNYANTANSSVLGFSSFFSSNKLGVQ